MLNAKQKRTDRIKDELRRMTLEDSNKYCAVCGMRGPLYVVIDFQTFVCSTCSAIHRSMQHKVKGISMSEFTDDEIIGLRVGGNKRAALIWKVGYHGTPPQGDEYRVRESIRLCFTERAYFDRDAYAQLQDDIANATLPPLKVLTSLDAINGSPSNGSVPKQSQPTTTSAAQHHAPLKPSVDAFDSLEFFSTPSQPPGTVPSASATAATSTGTQGDAFDDFFASRSNQHATKPQQPLTSAPPAQPQRTTTALHDDLFGPSVGAPPSAAAATKPPVTQPQHAPAHDDFFGPASSAPASRGTTDFFSAPTHAPAHAPSASGGSNMHQNLFQQTVWEQRPVEVDALHMLPAPTAPPAAPPASTMSNAFADLDPFGGKGAKRM